jgi:hypothetical protein
MMELGQVFINLGWPLAGFLFANAVGQNLRTHLTIRKMSECEKVQFKAYQKTLEEIRQRVVR